MHLVPTFDLSGLTNSKYFITNLLGQGTSMLPLLLLAQFPRSPVGVTGQLAV